MAVEGEDEDGLFRKGKISLLFLSLSLSLSLTMFLSLLSNLASHRWVSVPSRNNRCPNEVDKRFRLTELLVRLDFG